MNDRPILGRRLFGGVALGPMLSLDAGSSLLVVGPTQSGKTTSIVVPALLRWRDALVVTSVKRDVVAATIRWRRSLGEVQVLEPGRDDGLTWDPMEGVTTMRHATRAARDLTSNASERGDTEFWNALATKLVAGLMVVAADRGQTIFEVTGALEHHELEEWLGADASAAAQAVRTFLRHDRRTLDGVFTTAETMLLPWRFSQPLARVRPTLTGANTLYLCSPRGEQRHYEPLFRGALRMVLDEQQDRVEAGGARRLLMVLDEAATVACLDELDQLAATVSGLGVTLVSVVQDFAQLHARWGPRAATIVNNHATRVVVAGLADATVATYLPEVLESRGDVAAVPLRRRPRGTAVVVSGAREVFSVKLRPWWRVRRLRHRGERGRSLRFTNGVRVPAAYGTDLRD